MLMLNAKKGLSALQLSRDLDVNKNTAWRITMQIRKAMTQAKQRSLLTGIVEMDEAYIGGKPRKGSYHEGDKPGKRGRGTNKAPVIGAVRTRWQGNGQSNNQGGDEGAAYAGFRSGAR